MFKIERQGYGYKITFGGFMRADEMRTWVEESQRVLMTQTGSFGVVVDMRDLKPLPSDAQDLMQNGQRLYKAKGMARSAVILQNSILTLQFKRIAQETGIYGWERYIDASKVIGWEQAATAWVASGADPDRIAA